ncbi:hypothetical protein XHC_1301 [Xanthomonas hortorum pv. carotae str. M081]|nr:hypothetical protein XHC_1301 [Xanthomonas hortorum pv. carotae str. M081]
MSAVRRRLRRAAYHGAARAAACTGGARQRQLRLS